MMDHRSGLYVSYFLSILSNSSTRETDMIKSWAILQKAILHLTIWQNWCFDHFYHLRIWSFEKRWSASLRASFFSVAKSETIQRKWETYNPDHREDLFNDKVMTNHVNSMSKVLLEDMELRSRFNGKYVWQYRLSSFQMGGTKLERFLSKLSKFSTYPKEIFEVRELM